MRVKTTVLVAGLVTAVAISVCEAQQPSTPPAASSEQVAAKHEIDHSPGQGSFTPVFLTVYLRKDGDWGKGDCITVFPETAEVSKTKKPKKVRWVVLDKQEYHQWEITPKTAGDERVPPLDKKIGKGMDKNAFWSGPPSSEGIPYTWGYSIKLTEVDGAGDLTGNTCDKDPGVHVKG
jgi:hypothetical protein